MVAKSALNMRPRTTGRVQPSAARASGGHALRSAGVARGGRGAAVVNNRNDTRGGQHAAAGGEDGSSGARPPRARRGSQGTCSSKRVFGLDRWLQYQSAVVLCKHGVQIDKDALGTPTTRAEKGLHPTGMPKRRRLDVAPPTPVPRATERATPWSTCARSPRRCPSLAAIKTIELLRGIHLEATAVRARSWRRGWATW